MFLFRFSSVAGKKSGGSLFLLIRIGTLGVLCFSGLLSSFKGTEFRYKPSISERALFGCIENCLNSLHLSILNLLLYQVGFDRKNESYSKAQE